MSDELHFQRPPSMPGLLLRAAITRKPAAMAPVPALTAQLDELSVDAKHLARYSAVCGFASDSDYLPATYPHMPAFSLQMEMLLHKSFPFSPIGMVHTRNSISQFRPIHREEKLALSCAVSDSRTTEIGLEVDITTEATIKGEKVWSELTTVLKRGKTSVKPAKGPKKHAPMQDFAEREDWSLAGNLGRRYARASGDFNPIHLFPASAKLLGFKRHIAHGMWSKARCLAALQDRLGTEAFCLDVDFKTPLFLPATVSLHYGDDEQGVQFSLRDANSNRPHVNGSLKAL